VSCQRAVEIIHSYADGELDRLESAAVQRHIDECNDCNLRYCRVISMRSSLQDASLYYRASRELKRRIKTSLQQEVETEATLRR
jgi:anti-sigma factor RsiW